MSIRYPLLIFFLLFVLSLKAQPDLLLEKNIIFEGLPKELGLSQRSINCIFQDSEGFIWLGTWSGLIKYDGYTTKTYKASRKPGSLKSNKIMEIVEDNEGTMWVGTGIGGFYKYNRANDTFKQFKQREGENSVSNNSVWSILPEGKNTLWIGTEYGLNKFDTKTEVFTSYFKEPENINSLTHNFITDIFQDSAGTKWISTEFGLNKMIEKQSSVSFQPFTYNEDSNNSHLHNYIYKITGTGDAIWMATKLGLKKLENSVWKNFTWEGKSASFSFFRELYSFNIENPVMLLGSALGLNIFDLQKEKFVRFLGNYDPQVNLTHNTVTSIFLDQSDLLWVGTQKGLNKFDTYDKGFMLYPTAKLNTTNSIISGVTGDDSENYWISTLGGGLYRAEKKDQSFQFERYRLETDRLVDFTDFVQTLQVDKEKQLWMGTAGDGLFRIPYDKVSKANVFSSYTNFSPTAEASRKLSDNYVMSIEVGHNGVVWVGTWSGGLNKIESDSVTQYLDRQLTTAPIVTLFQDSFGTLWIGTRGNGLIKAQFDGIKNPDLKKYCFQNDSSSISNDFINVIMEDHSGNLWIGSEGGLELYDRTKGAFTKYPINKLRESEIVVGILEDSSGRLWISHNNGISVIKPFDPDFETQNYDRSDRIQGGFFYNNTAYKTNEGNLLFGGADGLNFIRPEIIKNPNAPEVLLKDMEIFNEPILPGVAYGGHVVLSSSLNKDGEIKLNYDQNSISFDLVATDYSSPKKNKFQFKLEGFDKDWRLTNSDQRFINYTNLPDGDYFLKVKASNNEGVWGEEKQLHITIYPPWWRSSWAILVYTIVMIAILFAFRALILMRANFVNNLKLERLEKQSLEQLNKAKLQFFTNISHEFRTPLTLIAGPLQKILDSGEMNKYIRENLVVVHQNTQRLLRLVGQLLDFRKADAGNLRLQVAEGNIVKFLKEIELSFSGLAEEKQINLKFQSTSNIVNLWYDRDQMEKVFFNLLSNAFKHTPLEGTITIAVIESNEDIKIHIEDSGSGINLKDFDRIFERFFSLDDDQHGTGIGLALAKSIVELHKGIISVESKANEFTRFTIALKKGHSQFKESEILHDFKDSEVIDRYTELADFASESFSENKKEPTPKELENWFKLLIVEDNNDVRSYIKSLFNDKYIILEANNGASGVEIAETEIPDLIISDVMMPGMDGITLCKTIRKNIRTCHIPIILLTARTSLIFNVEGLESGADDYVTKPFNPKLLELKVHNIIKAREMLKKEFGDKNILNIEPKRVTLTSRDEQFITQALENIEENMSNSEYSVEDLGRATSMSRMQLYRKLKALTGQSANEFIRAIRLKRAAQLIEQNELTIAEVTYEVGFSDLPYFRNCFKKLFGVNPSEYKSENKEIEN